LHDRAELVALAGQSAGEIIHAAACYGAGKSATTRRGLPGELRPPPGEARVVDRKLASCNDRWKLSSGVFQSPTSVPRSRWMIEPGAS